MADRLSIKWVEGNTNTTPTTTSNTTFNIDDPVFWPALSVISGLASGLCERRAVLDSTFMTGAATSAIWDNANTAAASATRATIVRNCMNNIASGVPVNSLYYTASDPVFLPIGTAGISNYMTAMDAAITTILDKNSYNDMDGNVYTFDTLAQAASASATAAGSSLNQQYSITSDGGVFNSIFVPSLPAEWALERKWMLEQLRYSGPQGLNICTSSNCFSVDYYKGTLSAYSSGNAIKISGGVSYTSSAAFTDVAETSYATSGVQTGTRPVIMAPYYMTCMGSTAEPTTTFSLRFADFISMGYAAQPQLDYSEKNNGAGMIYVREASSVDLQSAANDSKSYCVLSGGTLSIIGAANEYELDTVAVEAGGSVIFMNSKAHTRDLFVFSGGYVSPYISSGMLYSYATRIIYDFCVPYQPGNDARWPADVQAASPIGNYYIQDTIIAEPSVAFTVTSDAVVSVKTRFTFDNPDDILVSGGTLALISSGIVDHNVTVLDGVVTLAQGTTVGQHIDVFAGGTVSMIANTASNDTTRADWLIVHSGGRLIINGDVKFSIGELVVQDGATVNIDLPNITSSAFITNIDSVYIYHYCTFGLFGDTVATDTNKGWITLTGTSIGDSSPYAVYELGSNTTVGISSYAGNSALSDMSSRISGTCKVGSDTYSNLEALCTGLFYVSSGTTHYMAADTNIFYGARVVGKNRDIGKDYYPEFYVRQNKLPQDPADTVAEE